MNFKEFIKPTTAKIILTFLLLIITTIIFLFIPNPIMPFVVFFNGSVKTLSYGFPFGFLRYICNVDGKECIGFPGIGDLIGDLIFLILDLIIWYSVSCLIFYLFSLSKRK